MAEEPRLIFCQKLIVLTVCYRLILPVTRILDMLFMVCYIRLNTQQEGVLSFCMKVTIIRRIFI